MTLKKRVVILLAASLAASACSGAKGRGGGGDRTAHPAPEWFHNKPQNNARSLYFVGEATNKPDESTARDFAVQKALAELTQYCGASITSESNSSEVYKDGKTELMVSVNVDIAGDEMTIREAVVNQSIVGEGSDGAYDGYVLLVWPRAQYQQVLAAQSDRAHRALQKFLAAETAAKDNDIHLASTTLKEAKTILGPMKSTVPLKHDRLANSSLLWDAMEALKARLKQVEKERRSVLAVSVQCRSRGKVARCRSKRVGAFKEVVSGAGLKVSTDSISNAITKEILDSASPEPDASLRSSGYVLAIRFEADAPIVEDGFTFVYCGARGVVYDTNANRSLSVKEVEPQKGGSVNAKDATKKGCDKAQKQVVTWLQQELASIKR